MLVRSRRTTILVDAGVPHEDLHRRLESIGALPSEIEAVVVTHGHADHVAAAPLLSKRHGLEVWAARTTFRNPEKRPERLRVFEPSRPFQVGEIRVHPFPVPHDARPTVGFVLEADGVRLGYATDLGHVPEDAIAALSGADGIVLEANHDPEMLREGPYPALLKKRIAGLEGHLSNEQAAVALARLAHPRLRCVVLAHRSEKNNTASLATERVRDALEGTPAREARLAVALQESPLGPFELEG